MMYCPKCHSPVEKARLDVYWCKYCSTASLIRLLSYKSLEEASETNHEAQLKQDFLEPLILPHKE